MFTHKYRVETVEDDIVQLSSEYLYLFLFTESFTTRFFNTFIHNRGHSYLSLYMPWVCLKFDLSNYSPAHL